MDPYETLGVGKDADDKEIKNAYKEAAKKAHPDREGGSKEAFHDVQNSYLILSDPKRRESYDRTGKTDEQHRDKSIDILGGMLDSILERDEVTERVDILNILQTAIRETIMEGKMKMTKNNSKMKRLEKIVKRFVKKSKEGGNLFSAIAQSKVDNLKEENRDLENQIRDYDRALTISEDYYFEVAENPFGDYGGKAQTLRRFSEVWQQSNS